MQAQTLQTGQRGKQDQRKANLRLALILASLAAIFALGFVARMAWFNS